MSICGKYDLYDYVSMEKMYLSYPENPNNPLVSNILECFEIFKEKTGGVIYQFVDVKVNLLNQFLVEEMCPEFKVLSHKITLKDKRYKEGKKEKIFYTYSFRGKEYATLNEVNKENIYIRRKIYFNNIIELIPYFPYAIACSAYSEGKEHVTISRKSYIDQIYEYNLESGCTHPDNSNHMYRKRLAEITKDIVLKECKKEECKDE